jgi:quinoprotein glucose dehydrogenase
VNIANAIGGTNWTGGGYDPETQTVFVPAVNANVGSYSLVPPPPGFSDIRYVRGVEGLPFAPAFGPGDCCAADSGYRTRDDLPPAPPMPPGVTAPPLTVQGLSIVKPPYGLIAALDLNRGDLLWQVPNGETPDNVRNHAALKGMNIPRTGQPGNAGLVVTKTLVIAGEPQFTTTADRPRGAMLRSYDKKTGQEVGSVYMPAPQSGSPMTYMVDGKQYLVVAVSAIAGRESYSGEYIAYRLPD